MEMSKYIIEKCYSYFKGIRERMEEDAKVKIGYYVKKYKN